MTTVHSLALAALAALVAAVTATVAYVEEAAKGASIPAPTIAID
jgi:hypothetical protein